jgi:hypothetical protein
MSSVAETLDCDSALGSIDPAIHYALSAFPAAVVDEVTGPIRLMLGQPAARGTAQAVRPSPLTGDGFPVEFAFCTADARLRLTLEPGCADSRCRLDAASDLIRRMSTDAIPSEVLDALRAMQSPGQLAYGAWIGCRVGRDGMAFKLYAEVPPGGRMASISPAIPTLADSIAVVPRMLAYTPATQAFEAYFRAPSLEPRYLPAVLAPAGIEGQTQPLINFLEDAYGYCIRDRLPGPSVGISYVTDPERSRITLHFYARAIWGSDARIREGFTRVARAFAWNERPYLHVTRPIAARESWQTFHGLLSVTLDESQQVSLSIGVRPVLP